jgi:hypothetical protein
VRATIFVSIEEGGFCIKQTGLVDKRIVKKVEDYTKEQQVILIQEAVENCHDDKIYVSWSWKKTFEIEFL